MPADLLLVFREADPRTGGLGIDVADVARGMAARGHAVEVLTMRVPGADAPNLGPEVAVRALEPWLRRRPGVAFGLARGAGAVARRGRRIVHLYSCLPVHLHWAAAAAARRAGRPLVWTPMLHPGRRALWREHGLAGRAMAAWDAMAVRAAPRVDAVCAATRAEAELFRALGAPRVALVPSGVHAVPPTPDEEARGLRARLGLSGAPLVLCVAGRPDRRKGLDFAARTLAALHRRVPGAVLGVVGLPADTPLARMPGVMALGRLSLADLRAAYRAADAVLVPSRYEAFSRVVIEAWQQERPVVVTDRVGLAEAVRGGGGAVVPWGDAGAAAEALAAYLTDPARATRDGAQGAQLVAERYLVSHSLDRLEALYAEVAR